MLIQGLEQNYYLCRNDIWVDVEGNDETLSKLFVKITNSGNGESFEFLFTANSDGVVSFNISAAVHALMNRPIYTVNYLATLQKFQLYFKGRYENGEEKEHTINRAFILGGRKTTTERNYISEGESLLINQLVKWKGINLPFYNYVLKNGNIVQQPTKSPKQLILPCEHDYKAVLFRNSLGAYQIWMFEKYEIKTKAKGGKVVQLQGTHRNLPTEVNRTIEMFTKTPAELQDIIDDLIMSDEVYLLDNKWRRERLVVEDNEAIFNNWDASYQNKITFSFNNLIKR